MEDENIIKELYYGKIAPYEKQVYTKEYNDIHKKLIATENKFLDKLDDEMKIEYENIIKLHCDLGIVYTEEKFIDGFKIGVKLVQEVFKN